MVDDLDLNLVAMEVALAPLALPIVTARSGNEALIRLLETDIALILLDVQMPDMDGFETAELIRGRKRTQHIPIIFVTARDAAPDIVKRAYRLGAVDFLTKPIDTEVLLAKAQVFVELQDRADRLAEERVRREREAARRDDEQRRLEEELAAHEAMNAALAEADRRKDSFLAILGHELRNPLAPLRTAIDMLLADPRNVTPKVLGALDRQTRTMVRLVDDLLDISRIKANKLELRMETVDLRGVIEQAIATTRPQMQERRHTLSTSVPADPVWARVDPIRFGQVITNLLTNASRYMDPGGEVALACVVEDNDVAIRVIDKGIGISRDRLDDIFTMFVQERVRSDGFGGLGLGLSLARHLVDLHGGSIRADSAGRGHGSTFEVRVPVCPAPARTKTGEQAPLEKAAAAAIAAMTQSAPLRIVLVDDNIDARELLACALSARGHTVHEADDGPSGLELIARERPDFAFVDIGLPGMDGLNVATSLRRQVPDLRTRLVALTGYGNEADRNQTREAGYEAHLTKPTPLAAIFAVLTDRT